MKSLIYFLLTFLFFLPNVNAQEQHTFSSKEDIFNNWIKQNGQTAYNWSNDRHRVGTFLQTYWYEVRNFDCWQWEYSEIPTEATVTSVTIKFRANKGNWPDTFTFSLHSIPYILNTPNVNFFNESNSNQIYISSALTPDANHNVFFNQTFTAQTPVGQGWEVWNAVKTAVQSGNFFLTLGIREQSPSSPPIWDLSGYDGGYSSSPSIDLTINFTTPNNYYTFKNKIQTSENFGSLILNNDTQHPIPSGGTPIFLPWASPNSVRTSELPFLVNWNSTNTTQKHNYWDIQSSNFDYSLHHNFQAISSSPSELKATFLSTANANVKNYALEMSSSAIGNINLKDPWFYYKDQNNNWFHTNEFKNYSSPLTIQNNLSTSYGGVFLNQPYTGTNPVNYSVQVDAVQDIYLGQTGKTHKFYFQNWSGANVNYQNANALETPVVFTSDGATAQANLKGTELSDNINAFASNSQKKLVRTTEGNLYKVYESMNRVWLEKSTNNGITWTVENNGKPLSSNDAKLPAIDYNSGSEIIIVWQEKNPNYGEETFKIRLAHYQRPGTQFVFYDVFDGSIDPLYLPYSFNTMPVISWANSKILVVWKYEYGLNYKYGYADCYGPTTWYTTSEYGDYVTSTDVNSTNPTIVIRKDGGTTAFHLGWQQSTTAIKYCTLTPNAQNIITQSTVETPSTGDAVSYKKDPSISIRSDGYPTLVWIGSIYEGATTQVTRRTKSPRGWATTIDKYGSNVESPTEYNNIITWSESNANKLYKPWGGIRTLSTIGKSVQLTNNVSNTQYAVAYRQFSPYDFQTSIDVLSLAKENSIINQCGREGIVRKGDAEFYFIFGDVMVSNEIIQFIDIPDSTALLTTNDLNNYMETNTFQINSSSNFYFSLAFGSPDTVRALSELQGNFSLSYKVELVDAVTNEIIGLLKEATTNENNISIGEIISYEVNTQSIGERAVKLRVSTNTNFAGTYYLADIISEEEVLGKRNSEKIDLSNIIVTSYELFQNYPNPFNPSTTIKFQLPKDGMVTLKIYDILGNEITTLINEEKAQGRYEVNFNASTLASGVYFYRLQAGSFTASKKIILLK